ncbi:MAG: hypothetical protein GX677_00040 [Treponema sp.]|nr:hypothetical protein [Treponema sp.]
MKKLIKLFYALTVSALIIFASGVSVSADDANIEPYAFVCAPNRSVEVVGKS